MKLLRNPEVARTAALFICVSLAASAVGFRLDIRCGLLVTALSALLLLLHLGATRRRYRKIAAMAAAVNATLHGSDAIPMQLYAEGELGVLQSELYKMTVRLREQQQQLLSEKSLLADAMADISHQIRTPLTSANLLAQFLSEPDVTPARRRELVRELYELLSRMDWLITTLLKLSRLDADAVTFRRETVPMEAYIRQALAPLLVPIELRGQTLSVAASGAFSGDILWICEALVNIVKNCMEHTPAGGEIAVTATENALYTEIVVTDTGSGIDSADLPHIFERFYKGKHSDDKSFGIGLHLAQRIVTRQNGILQAENGRGGGARFTMRFYKSVV